SWRGACDACLDAGGGTFAVADRGYSMGRPRRRNSLTEIFKLPLHRITRDLITSQAINWGLDAFARGAYSYATPKTREAQPRCENWMLATYSFLAKHCMPAGIWAQSKRHWLMERKQRRRFWPPDNRAHPSQSGGRHSEGSNRCPLWVKSRHRRTSNQCPLYPQ